MTPYANQREFVRMLREALRNSYRKEGFSGKKSSEAANEDLRLDRSEAPYRKRPDGSYGK